MTKDESKLMAQYGITCERRSVYLFAGHKYEKFEDALAYAKMDAKRKRQPAPSQT